MKRSQYTVEFMIFFALLTLLFVMWISIYIEWNRDALQERHRQAVNDLGNSIHSYLDMTASAPSGFYTNRLIIPERINGKDFEIFTNNYSFVIRSENQDYIYETSILVGSLKKGQNNLWNEKGIVCIGRSKCVASDTEISFPVIMVTPTFNILNSGGATVAVFDENGNIFIKGILNIGGICDPGTWFIIEESGGSDVAYIDELGNFCIEGTYEEHSTECDVEGDELFVIKDESTNLVTLDDEGNLCHIGGMIQNWPG